MAVNNDKIGKVLRVIIDREEEDFYIGRTEFDSPEVDGEVLIDKSDEMIAGEMYDVKITSALPFDLMGEKA